MTHRLFVGIDLPDDVRAGLARLRHGVRGARWVAPENLHVTLRFIGDVDGRQADDIHDALTGLSGRCFTVELRDAGTFATGRRARTLWAGVAPSPDLDAIKARVDSALVRAGIGPDERKFVPHVTLARLRDASIAEVGRRVAEMAPEVSGRFSVDAVVLFQSHATASGSHYDREAAYPLALA